MKKTRRNLLLEWMIKIYSWFFRISPGKEAEKFLESIIYVFIATGIAKGLLFIMNIVGGRVLGQTIYGEYTLIVSVTAIIGIPIGFGVIGGLLRSLAETDEEKKRKLIISTASRYFLITLIVFTATYLLFYKDFAAIAKMGPLVFVMTAVLMVFWFSTSVFDATLKGLHKQKEWSIITATSYFIAFVAFGILFLKGEKGILFLYIPTVIAYGLFSIASFFITKKYFSFEFGKSEFKEMFNYGFYGLIMTLAVTLLGNVDKIMLNYFLGAESVGIYQAYYFSSIMLIGVITGVFVSVFFPIAVKIKDLSGMLNKLDKVALFVAPALIIIVPVIIYIVILLYGYEFNFFRSVLFMVATVLDVLVVLYSALLSAQGLKAIKWNTFSLIAAFVVNIHLNYFFIDLWGVNGAIMATAASFLILLLSIRISIKKFERVKMNNEKKL